MRRYVATVQPKNNARAGSGARSSCAARTRKPQQEVKMFRVITRSSRTHERVHVQNVRDFPQTLDGEIISPFLLNEHGDPRIFFGYLLRTV